MSIDRVGDGAWPVAHGGKAQAAGAPRTAFDALLDQAVGPSRAPQGDPTEGSSVRFSKHALARLRSRGLDVSHADVADLEHAVDRLAQHGARESLILLEDQAFVVGVPRRTVITAMPRDEAIGSIFTNIDSTLVIR